MSAVLKCECGEEFYDAECFASHVRACSSSCSAEIDDPKELLEKIRTAKAPSRRGVILCGTAMAECLKLGWSRDALHSLEIIWWSCHDRNGNLIEPNNQADRLIEGNKGPLCYGCGSRPASCSAWVSEKVASLFAGRRGHGGGRCTRRVLYPEELAILLTEAYTAGKQNAKDKQRSESR